MKVEKKLKELGIILPKLAKPVAEYLPYRKTGNLIYISGQDYRVKGKLQYQGKVGKDITKEEGYTAARIATINALSVLKEAIGSLDKVVKIVSLHGFVNSADGFVRQPYVINGASEPLVKIFSAGGRHSRCALSANELPFNTPVELEMIVEVED